MKFVFFGTLAFFALLGLLDHRHSWRSARVKFLLLIALLATVLAVLSGCAGPGTVTAPPVAALAPSFDGTDPTSGLIAIVPGGRIISASERDGYNDQVGLRGSDAQFSPALKFDAGVKPAGANYFIDDEHFVDFGLMLKWKRNQDPRHAPKTLLQKAVNL